MCRFYLYKRASSGIFYAEFTNEKTGKRIAYRSTGKTKKNEALLIAVNWAANGLPERNGNQRSWDETHSASEVLQAVKSSPLSPQDAARIVAVLTERELISHESRKRKGPNNEPFCAWLRAFWTYDTSPYIAERLAHGQRATNRHCQDMIGRVKGIEAILGSEISIVEIKRSHLSDLGIQLRKNGLAASTVNKTMSVATTALRWAAAKDIIPIDPTRGLRSFAGPKRKRGILTYEEAEKLFTIQWPDERARVASWVAMTTSMRIGEILALQRQDIGKKRLEVRHSYSGCDGLKSPKNGEEREAVLLPEVRAALIALEKKSPHPSSPERFIFAGRYADRPIDDKRILAGFRQALVIAQGFSWDDEEARSRVLGTYKERAIDFHSWRHFYTKRIADRVDQRTGQLGTGHKSQAMFEEYADHATEEDMDVLEAATKDAFSRLLKNASIHQSTD